jgi:hypothetical protein
MSVRNIVTPPMTGSEMTLEQLTDAALAAQTAWHQDPTSAELASEATYACWRLCDAAEVRDDDSPLRPALDELVRGRRGWHEGHDDAAATVRHAMRRLHRLRAGESDPGPYSPALELTAALLTNLGKKDD